MKMQSSKSPATFSPVTTASAPVITYTDRNADIVRNVGNKVVTFPTPGEGFNGISRLSQGTMDGVANYVNLTLENAGGAAVTYIIGDPDGIVAAAGGLTVVPPDSGSITPSVFNASCRRGYAIERINYEVTTSPVQFQQAFNVVRGDVNGGFNRDPYNIAGANRPTNFNPNLLVLELGGRVILDQTHALVLTVRPGETVALSIEFAAVGN